MKKYRILTILLLLSLLSSLFCLPAAAAEELDLYCTHAVLVDVKHDEILYEKSAYDKAYPASITKVMTALLVLEAIEEGSLSQDTLITASSEAVTRDYHPQASTANIKADEVLSVKDLLYCLLLPSANEAANVLAEAVDGSIDAFVEHMNQRAQELGCEGTHFVNPHGLHNDDHYTTAYDISLYMRAAMEHELFLEIIATPSYTIAPTNISKERLFYNTNGLISNLYYSGHVYEKSIGGKTGSTDEAGRCLVSAAKDGDSLLVSVILGSGPIEVDGRTRQGQFTESKKLLEYGFNNFHRVTITREEEPVDKIAVTLSRDADEVMVKPQGSITLTLPKSLDLDQVQTDIVLFSDSVEAPVEEGQILGRMDLTLEDKPLGSLDLVAVTSVERSELLYKKVQFLNFMEEYGLRIAIGVVLFLVLICLLLVLRKRRRRYRSSYRGGRSRSSYRGSRR